MYGRIKRQRVVILQYILKRVDATWRFTTVKSGVFHSDEHLGESKTESEILQYVSHEPRPGRFFIELKKQGAKISWYNPLNLEHTVMV
jgi:hypothetical protein